MVSNVPNVPSAKESPLLDLKEAAKILHVHPNTVRNRIDAGELPPVRVGARVLIRAAEVQKFIDAGGSKRGESRMDLRPILKETKE